MVLFLAAHKMRVFCWLAIFAYLPLLLAQDAPPVSNMTSLGSSLEERMERRQVLTLNVCANLRLTIPGITLLGIPLASITLADPICLCLANGVLTPQSLARAELSLTTKGTPNNGLLSGVLKLVGGTVAGLLTSVTNIATPILGRTSTSCVYPANSVPDDCGGCGFVCATNYKLCNGMCISSTRTCATGGTQGRKRQIPQKLREDLRCPKGFDACAVPHAGDSRRWTGRAYDCVDARTDLESCGGCMFPMEHQQQAVDCTSIPHTAAVACISSTCVVQSCLRGYAVANGTDCVKVGKGRRAQLGQAIVWSAKDRQ